MGAPSRSGELAKSAVATGCSASPMRNFSTMSASVEKSRLTCMGEGWERGRVVEWLGESVLSSTTSASEEKSRLTCMGWGVIQLVCLVGWLF